jgi:hypothetical protein
MVRFPKLIASACFVGLAACAHSQAPSAPAAPATISVSPAVAAPLALTNKMPDDESDRARMDREDLRHAINAQVDALRDEVDTLSAHAASASDQSASQLGYTMTELLKRKNALAAAAERMDDVSDAEWPRFANETRALIDDAARLIAQAHQQGL